MQATGSVVHPDGTDVLIVANFASPASPGNNRFVDLAHRLKALGARVEFVTSSFDHISLALRQYPTTHLGFDVTFVHEPGYRNNISAKRLISQHAFGRSIAKYLRERTTPPGLIYCATPPPGAARECAEYANREGVPFVVDVQDLWPEAFSMHFRHPKAIHALFYRMVRSSRIAYQAADLIVGVSQTYIDHAEKVAKRSLPSSVVFLGTALAPSLGEEFPGHQVNTKSDAEIVYAGTLSHSYDLRLIIDAMAMLARADKKFSGLELVVLGDGPMRTAFEEYSRSQQVAATFYGKVPYRQMLRRINQAAIAVNPIVAGSMGSVINKVGDYAAAGAAVINTQESPEYRALLEDYSAGINCRNGDAADVADAMRRLFTDRQLRLEMGLNNRRMAEELFDRNKTYDALARSLLSLARQESPR